jgi:hypothetical protein
MNQQVSCALSSSSPSLYWAKRPLPSMRTRCCQTLSRGVPGEVGGGLVRGEVDGKRGAGGTLGQGAVGHGGLSGGARHRQANRCRAGWAGEGEEEGELSCRRSTVRWPSSGNRPAAATGWRTRPGWRPARRPTARLVSRTRTVRPLTQAGTPRPRLTCRCLGPVPCGRVLGSTTPPATSHGGSGERSLPWPRTPGVPPTPRTTACVPPQEASRGHFNPPQPPNTTVRPPSGAVLCHPIEAIDSEPSRVGFPGSESSRAGCACWAPPETGASAAEVSRRRG